MKKFKLVTLLGIRPDYIRMYKVIKLLDEQGKDDIEHILVHSGQHYDPQLFGVFLKEFNIRQPDIDLGIGLDLKESGKTSHAYQTGLLGERTYEMLEKIKPDAVMYLGDTNTVLSSVVVSRSGYPVIHLEAGGRSFDWRMPEEKNRLVADHMSDVLYSYMQRYKDQLLNEGIDDFRIKVIGNIIHDPLEEFAETIDASTIMQKLGVEEKKFILVTIHREENITNAEILKNKLSDILKFAKEQKMPIVMPLMPRTLASMEKFGLMDIMKDPAWVTDKPFGFFDFTKLEKMARLIVTDSGTVQEDSLILGTPSVICRRSTERPETMWAGASVLEGIEGEGTLYNKMKEAWSLPLEWDRTVLNPEGGSPSQRVFDDLISKVRSNWFKTSRSYETLKENEAVRKAYGQ